MVSNKVLSRALVALVVIDNIFILTWQSSIDWISEENSGNNEDLVYVLITLAVTGAFSIGYVVRAAFFENKFDLVPFLLANTILTLAASNLDNFHLLGVPLVERILVLGCFWLFHFLFVFMAWRLKEGMGWRFFTAFGADLRARHTYTYWQAYHTTRTLDVLLGFCVLFTEVYFDFLDGANEPSHFAHLDQLLILVGAVFLEQGLTLIAAWCIFPKNTTCGFWILSCTHVLFLGYCATRIKFWLHETWYTDVLNFLFPAMVNRVCFAIVTYKLKGFPAWDPSTFTMTDSVKDHPSVKIEVKQLSNISKMSMQQSSDALESVDKPTKQDSFYLDAHGGDEGLGGNSFDSHVSIASQATSVASDITWSSGGGIR